MESVGTEPVVHPAADTAIPSLATDIFSTSPPSEVQQPLSAAGSAPAEIESPKVTRKEKKSKKKTRAPEVEAESVAVAPVLVLPPIVEPPVVEPPLTPVPTPPPNRKLLFIAVAALILVVAVVLAIKLLTPTKSTPPPPPNQAYVTVKVTADGKPVSGAEVTIDGKSIGNSTADGTVEAKVEPGDRSLTVTSKDYQPWTRTVPVSQGERKSVEASLVHPQVEQGTIVVQAADVGAEVFVDGQSQGVIGRDHKLTINKIGVGSHRVQLRKSGYLDSREKSVDVVAKKTASPQPFEALVEIPGKTKIFVDVTPRDAVVRIDGKVVDNPGKGVRVEPGKHTVEASSEGYKTESESVSVEKDQELRAPAINLPKVPVPSFVASAANPPTIKRGEATTLTWKTKDARQVSIEGVGTFQGTDGTTTVSPQANTTYVLTAKGDGGSKTQTVTVNVVIPAAPKIDDFTATESTIVKGKSTKLKWNVQNAKEISIEPEVGGGLPPRGERDVRPTDTTEYVLTAKGDGVSITGKTRVTVTLPGKLAIEFKAADNSITQGQSTKLRWNVQNAAEVSIDHGIGSVPASGERTVSPAENTTYTLTATGEGGERGERKETVTVTAEPPGPKDLPAIHALLNRFTDAVKNHDRKGIVEAWPSIDKAHLDSYTDKKFQQVMDEQCPDSAAKFSADGAELTCSETLTAVVEGKAQAPRTNTYLIRFKRIGEAWKIESKPLK
jgi:hypothetical protein